MALAYLTINLDAFTGDDHPPVPSYSTITLDPGADHIDAANDVIHVRMIVVSLDRQGKAATANGVPCVDGKVPVVAGVAYAVSAPNVLRGGPHYIPALTAGPVVDLSDYITPGAPLTPDQAAALTARIVALEETPPGGGVTGVESVSGTVVLDGTGAPVREFWTTGAATINGVSFSADTAVVFRRTAAGSWGYKVVDGWTAVPIPDSTAPVAGTLASSAITATGFTLTVSGASDETALHAQPYNFSTDNGTTWTGWQASSSLAVTGKTASTAYQCRHKVRDAAGNETTGTAITVTTSAASVTGTLAYVGQQTMTADSNTMTYSSAPIGADDPARHLVVMLTWWAGGQRLLDLTVDGVAAPAPVHDSLGGAGLNRGYRLYVIPKPTGTTVTLGTSNANMFQATIAVWTATAQLSLVNGVHVDTTAGSSPVTLTPTSVNGGVVLAGFRSIANASTATWTGVTKRWERTAAQPGSGGDGTTSDTTTTVTLDTSPALSAVTRVGATALKWGA